MRRRFPLLSKAVHTTFEGLENRQLMSGGDPPDPIEPDMFEPNDNFASATDLGGFNGASGTIHFFTRLDVDYFRFTAPTSTTVSVRLDFIHQSGNLALNVFNGSQGLIGSSDTSSAAKNYERVTFPVQAGQNYYVKVSGQKSPDYSFSVQPLTANFDWSMPRRFGQVDQFGLPVAPNTRDYVMPNPVWVNGVETPTFPVQFTVPGGPTGGDITYAYNIVGTNGTNYSTTLNAAGTTVNCNLPNGTYTVTLTCSADGSSVTTQQNIVVKNFLIAAVGDSYNSGEGNPHSPAQYDWLGFATRGAIWAQGGDDLESLYNRMTHRSTKAGVAQMALAIENADPKTSVTFVFLSHTGSTIQDGLLNARNSSDPGAPGVIPAQLDRLQELTAGRTIDSLFMSIGGNDLGFGDILADLVKNDPFNPVWNYEDRITEIVNRSLSNVTTLANSGYPALATRLAQFTNLNQVYLTEYPDLSKQSDGQIAEQIIGDVVPGWEVDRHELTRLVNEVMPTFITAMHTAAAKFGWNYVDGILAAFGTHGYGDWFRTANDSCWMEGPLGNRNTITALDMQNTLGTMHPINGGLDAQRDALYADVTKANLVTSLFSLGGDVLHNNGGTWSITITNNSFLAGAPASMGAIYLSGDSSVDASDSRILTFNVPALAPGQSVTLSGTLPTLVDGFRTAGNRVFVAPVLDINGNVVESDEVDNRVFSPSKMAILQSEQDLAFNGTSWVINPHAMHVGETFGAKLGLDEIIGNADIDVYSIDVSAGQMIDIDIDVVGTLDTYVRVYDSMWGFPITFVGANDNGFAPGETLNAGDSYLRFSSQFGGRYFIAVSHVANQNASFETIVGRSVGATGQYSITLTNVNTTPPAVQAFAYDVEANKLTAQFSQDVGSSIASSVLQLVNQTTGQTLSTAWYTSSYNPATRTATFTFSSPLPNGNYVATLVGAQIHNSDGIPMAQNATQSFFALAGDVNRDRNVDFTDLLILAQNYGNSGRPYAQGNLDRSAGGNVDFNDLLILAQNYGRNLFASAAIIGSGESEEGVIVCNMPIRPTSNTPSRGTRGSIGETVYDEPMPVGSRQA